MRIQKILIGFVLSCLSLTMMGFVINPTKEKHPHYRSSNVCWFCGGYIQPFLPPVGGYQLNASFEDGDPTSGSDIIFNGALACTSDCMAISDSFAREGTHSILGIVYSSSPCTCGLSIRCEGLQRKSGADTLVKSRYYAISMFPRLYYSPLDDQNEVSMQWKTTSTSPQDPSPVLSMWERKISGLTRWRFVITVDSVNPNQSAAKTWEYDLGILESDVWTDWLFDIDWQDNHDGTIVFYKNGKALTGITKVSGPAGGSTNGTTIYGPNTNRFYNQVNRGYDPMRIGPYKFPYCQDPAKINTVLKAIYYDSWKIGADDMELNDFMIVDPAPPVIRYMGVPSRKKPANLHY